MPSLTSLTDGFDNLGFAEKQLDYHELQIEYPVLDLLPVDEPVTPFLDPPAYSGYREKPDPGKYHLPLSGTDFAIRLPTGKNSFSPLRTSDSDTLFTSLANLVTAPGRSLLQIVTYIDREDRDTYRFRLLTDRCGQLKVTQELTLSSAGWEEDRHTHGREVWMKLISRLLRRVSDRAYFHVHERLRHYRWYAKQVVDEQWNWKRAFDPRRFLAGNLMAVVGNPWKPDYVPVMEAFDFEGEGEATFLFPCGHEQDMLVQRLRAMSIYECIRFGCDECGARLIRHNAEWRLWLLLHRERERRVRFSAREAIWQQLADEYPIGYQRVSVRSDTLHMALKHAFLSVVSPESVSPLDLHMARSEHFAKCATIFQEKLQGEAVVTCASAGILEGLLNMLDRAIGEVEATGQESENLQSLPSGWNALARLWLIRATQLAGIPGYSGEDPVVVFGETAIEEGDVDYDDAALDELEFMMRDVRLG